MSNEKEQELSMVQRIVQHAINKEPSQMAPLINTEIASRVMNSIDQKRAEVGKQMFSK